MSIFLDQDAIDRLQYELNELSSKKGKAQDAIDKVKEMYMHCVRLPLLSDLSTLQEIGACIQRIYEVIRNDSPYYGTFCMLKLSYEKRISKYQ